MIAKQTLTVGNSLCKKMLSTRYIELMQTGDSLEYFKKYHVSASVFKNYLLKKNWNEVARVADAGPSINFVHSNYKGKFGIIAPYSKDFCKTCNRLRTLAGSATLMSLEFTK